MKTILDVLGYADFAEEPSLLLELMGVNGTPVLLLLFSSALFSKIEMKAKGTGSVLTNRK